MRSLLASSGLLSFALLAMTAVVWARSSRVMDWVRLGCDQGSVVMTCSRAHVAAAVVADPRRWSTGDGQPVHYRHFRPTDLRRKFPEHVGGFGWRADDGAYLVLCPLWAVALAGAVPAATWVLLPRRRARFAN